jgi:acetyl esterase/lipase
MSTISPFHRWRPFSPAVCILLAVSPSAYSAEPEAVLLWPTGAPGALGDTAKDKPALHIHRAGGETATGAAVVICPGGGYGAVMMSYEGHDVARWFNSFGVTAAVLEYRLGPRYRHPAPLQDVQRALRYLRSRAGDLGLRADRIGVLGFSAGGHLAASAATLFAPGVPDSADPIERVSSRPDFAVLAYPVITLEGAHAHAGSRTNLLGADAPQALISELSLQNRVTPQTPPVFLFHTGTDKAVPPENSLLFYGALRAAGVPAEVHIYREGPHGVGLDRHPATKSWPEEMRRWMEHLGLLERRGGGSP